MRALAKIHTDGSLAVVLEGDYNFNHLPFANLGVLDGLIDVETGMEDPHEFEEFHDDNTGVVGHRLADAREELADHRDVDGCGRL